MDTIVTRSDFYAVIFVLCTMTTMWKWMSSEDFKIEDLAVNAILFGLSIVGSLVLCAVIFGISCGLQKLIS